MILSPLTGSPDIILLKKLNAQDLTRVWEHSFKIDITNELKGHNAIFLYRCKKTDLQFFFPLDIFGSSSLYASLQQYHWYYMANRWEYGVAIENLANSKAILEIGSGFGSFLELAREAGLSITGIEVNHDAAKAAQNKGLPVADTDLNSLSHDLVDPFDAICAFQVLEHLPDPINFITSALKLLKAEGKLMLSVPNSASFLRHQFNLLDMPPHHMTRWSKKTFTALEALFPLKLEELLVEPLPAYQTQAYLAAYTQYLLSLSATMKVFFNRFTLPLYSAALKTSLRNLLAGQTLYAQFRKLK